MADKHSFDAGTETPPRELRSTPPEVYRGGKLFICLGLILLVAGSCLLLLGKLPVVETAVALAAGIGGFLILLGNGLIIYGLLVHSGWRAD